VLGLAGVVGVLLTRDSGDDDVASDTTEVPPTEPPATEPPDTEPPDTEPPDTEPPDTDPPATFDTEGEFKSVFDLEEGDCWDDPEDTDSSEVSEVEVVDCDEPHDNEVYLLFDLPGDEFDATAVDEGSQQGCLDAFEGFVGTAYEDSRLEIFPITPTSGSWEEGDREVICSVYDIELEKLVGSMEGSGR
jgi:hypothetical protein